MVPADPTYLYGYRTKSRGCFPTGAFEAVNSSSRDRLATELDRLWRPASMVLIEGGAMAKTACRWIDEDPPMGQESVRSDQPAMRSRESSPMFLTEP